MLKHILLLLGIASTLQAEGQRINRKVYISNDKSIMYLMPNNSEEHLNTKEPFAIDKVYYYSTLSNTADLISMRLGSVASSEVIVNNGSNSWILYDSLVISIELWDLRRSTPPTIQIQFRVVPLRGIAKSTSKEERPKLVNSINNLTNRPFLSILSFDKRNNDYAFDSASRVNYDFVESNGDLLFLIAIDDKPMEIWRCREQIQCHNGTFEEQFKFSHTADWELLGAIEFPPGRSGFLCIPKEDNIILIVSNNREYLLNMEKYTWMEIVDNNRSKERIPGVELILFNMDNEQIGRMTLNENWDLFTVNGAEKFYDTAVDSINDR